MSWFKNDAKPKSPKPTTLSGEALRVQCYGIHRQKEQKAQLTEFEILQQQINQLNKKVDEVLLIINKKGVDLK
jgi:TolA-binding protein